MCETSNKNQKHLRAEFHQKCSYSTSKKQKPGGKSKPKHKHTQSKYHYINLYLFYNLYYIKTISNITKYQNTHNQNITRREKAKIILVSNNYQASRSRSTGCNTAAGRSGVSRKVQLHTGTIIYLLSSFSSFTFQFLL